MNTNVRIDFNIWFSRYFMGTFAKPCIKHYESIIHFSDSAVTVNLNYGPFRYHFLGVHTVYEFLNDSNVFGQKQVPICFDSYPNLPYLFEY